MFELKECPDGKHGDGCLMDCAHCTNLKQCHHVNGTCLRGCAVGYIGDECKCTYKFKVITCSFPSLHYMPLLDLSIVINNVMSLIPIANCWNWSIT